MKAEKFLEKNQDIIIEALEDYQKWFEKGEDSYKQCQRALSDLDKVE